jgi:RNA polymerase sigma factor (sigma-70 family)
VTDEQLALDFQRGDKDAFAEVYRLYHEDVREQIRYRTHPNMQSELDDICQHFWMAIHRWGRSYDPARPLQNWLIATASKATASYYKASTRKRNLNLIGQGYAQLGEDEIGHPIDEGPSPETCAIFQEDFAAVEEALKQIPPQFQKVIDAIYLRGFDPLEYATLNGIARATVYTQLKRGIEHLQRVLCLEPA